MAIQVIPTPSSSSLYSRVALVTSSSTWAHPDGYASPRPVKIVKINGGNGGKGGGIDMTNANIDNNAQNAPGGGSGFVQINESYITGDLSVVIGAGGSGGQGAFATSSSTTVYTSTFMAAYGGTTTVIGNGAYMVLSNTTAGQFAMGQTFYSQGQDHSKGLSGGGAAGNRGAGNPGSGAGEGQNGLIAASGTSAMANLMFQGLSFAPGGGGSGASANYNSATNYAGGSGGIGFNGLTGGTGGTNRAVFNASATADNGAAGAIFGNGGGGGGCVSIRTSGATYTATAGNGGSGGNGAVMIFY
jgi:hypothetical protein